MLKYYKIEGNFVQEVILYETLEEAQNQIYEE